MDIKVRYLSEATVKNLDDMARKKGYKSRQEFLKEHLDTLSALDKILELDSRYSLLLDRVLKVLDYNTLALNKFMDENYISLGEIVEKERTEIE